MNSQSKAVAGNGDVGFKEILLTLWNHRILALAFILGTTGVVWASTYLVTKQYEATTTVSPASTSSNNTSGALGSLSNNLAALAGVPLSSDPKKVESIAVLESDALTGRYIRENNLLPVLYAGKWDAAHGRWKPSKPDEIPTVWKAVQYFKKNVMKVVTDAKTGLVTVSIKWNDPKIAATWANGIVKLTNNYERDDALVESDRNIAYLTDQAAKTDVVGIKQAIYSLLESEYDKAMLAKGNDEYSFKIIDPATVPERAAYPARTVWVLVAVFISSSFTLFVAFCVVAWRSD